MLTANCCLGIDIGNAFAGPADDVKALLKELEAEEVFNRALDTNGVPYHSSVLQPLLPELQKSEVLFLGACIQTPAIYLQLISMYVLGFSSTPCSSTPCG